MHTTMAPVTTASNQSAERSYLETLGELGFLKTIHPTNSLVQNACQLALQASSLNVIVATLLVCLIYHAPQSEVHGLLSQQSLFTAALASLNLVFSARAIRAVILANSFDDAICQVVASDVAVGQPFTALVTLKPKSVMFAKAIELELIGSKVVHGMDPARLLGSRSTWTSSTREPDRAVTIAQNLIFQSNQEYKIEQQLLIPQASSIRLNSRDLADSYQEYEWWVALRVKRSFWLEYECRFPLSASS
ncbi:unnamed protein product [Sphagnum balticum]